MPQLLRFAIALGASPLIIGSLIYLLWRLNRWDWLALMGLMTILIGIICFIAGAVCLILHQKRNAQAAQRSPLSSVVVGLLLMTNFPAAYFYTSSAFDISSRYTIRISNQSNLPVEQVLISGPTIEHKLGPTPAGENTIHHIYINEPGFLKFTIHQSATTLHGELEGYVHKGSTGDKTITIDASSSHHITDHLK